MPQTRTRPPAAEVLKDIPVHLMSHDDLGPVLLSDLCDAEDIHQELKELLDRRRSSLLGGIEGVYKDHALETFAHLGKAETAREEDVRFLLAMVDRLKSPDGALLVEVCDDWAEDPRDRYSTVAVRHVEYARGSRHLRGIFGSVTDPEVITFDVDSIIPDSSVYYPKHGRAGVFSHPS